MKNYKTFFLLLITFLITHVTPFFQNTSAPTFPDSTADRVIGQTDFVTATAGTTQTAMQSPSGIAIDTSAFPQILYVSETNNNRILGYYNYPFLQDGAPADFVIGQSDFVSASPGTSSTSGDCVASSASRRWSATAWSRHPITATRPCPTPRCSSARRLPRPYGATA